MSFSVGISPFKSQRCTIILFFAIFYNSNSFFVFVKRFCFLSKIAVDFQRYELKQLPAIVAGICSGHLTINVFCIKNVIAVVFKISFHKFVTVGFKQLFCMK